VIIEVQGMSEAVEQFQSNLVSNAPEHARIERVEKMEVEVEAAEGFSILDSLDQHAQRVLIPPDVGCCDDCLTEVFDEGNRRYRYAFTSCVNCGPRFTLIEGLPYDRTKTTMARFEMCSSCRKEFEDVDNRRYHVQPNACSVCGPRVTFLDSNGQPIECADPIAEAARAIRAGRIVAVKGLGGYHLACDATNPHAVSLLRHRKRRPNRPFAMMFPDVQSVRRLCELSSEEERELTGSRRPIVLLAVKKQIGASTLTQRRPRVPVEEVAPGLQQWGVMLPYTPLHEMLLQEIRRPIVLTSGNLAEEPIVHRDDEALERLNSIVRLYLVHDRDIATRCDDSIVRVWSGGSIVLRRSRGFVPAAIDVPVSASKRIFACGAQLKNTFCLLGTTPDASAGDNTDSIHPFPRGAQAVLSQHIGDLESLEAQSGYEEAVRHFLGLFDFKPEVIAHDLHPDFFSTRFLGSFRDVPRIAVQHHHAHLASCLAENCRQQPAIGVCWDGIGLGLDGSAWGAEFLVGDLKDFRRAGTFRPIPIPGGDVAAREPWRMGLAYLRDAFGNRWRNESKGFFENFHSGEMNIVQQMLESDVNCPCGSSMGRLFDAMSFLCLGIHRTTYEGQAALWLEQAAAQAAPTQDALPFEVDVHDDLLIVEPSKAILDAVARIRARTSASDVARIFHNGLCQVVVDVCLRLKSNGAPNCVALSGGCFQNRLLLDLCSARLVQEGFEVLTHHSVPPNDGGIALGQAVIAAARIG